MTVELKCGCGATTKVSDRKYRRHKGEYTKCNNCGAPLKIEKSEYGPAAWA